MKRALSAALLVVLAGIGVSRLDSATRVSTGSAGGLITNELQLAPDDPRCATAGFSGAPRDCPARYFFAPDRALSVWLTVRNEGRVDVTIDGLDEWLGTMPADLLIRPVRVLDGGPISSGLTGHGTPFKPVALAPGDERVLGIEMRTTADVAFACEHWGRGTAIGWDAIPVTWHWLALKRTTAIALAHGFEVMAPTESDCVRR